MKKIIALVLCAVMLLSFCACANTAKKLTKAEVESALSGCDGVLEAKGKEDNVKSFTFTMTDVSAEDLSDSDFLQDAFTQTILHDAFKMSGASSREIKAGKARVPVNCIFFLIAGEDDLPSIADLSEMAVNIISKGETIERNGWKLSATIDQKNDSVTFKVKK